MEKVLEPFSAKVQWRHHDRLSELDLFTGEQIDRQVEVSDVRAEDTLRIIEYSPYKPEQRQIDLDGDGEIDATAGAYGVSIVSRRDDIKPIDVTLLDDEVPQVGTDASITLSGESDSNIDAGVQVSINADVESLPIEDSTPIQRSRVFSPPTSSRSRAVHPKRKSKDKGQRHPFFSRKELG